MANYAITQQRTRIGRLADNDIVLNSPTVSSTHAVLSQHGSRLIVEDLGSRNGTFVADTRITNTELRDGDVLHIGDYTLTLCADRAAMAYEPTMLVRSAPKSAYMLRIDGSHKGEVLELNKVVMTLGSPGVCLVTCIRRADEFAVRFTEGEIVAKLNGVPLTATPVHLHAGDVLELDSGHLQFLIRDA